MGLHLLILAGTPVWIMALQAVLTRLGLLRGSGQAAAMISCGVAAIPTGALLWAACLRSLDGSGLLVAAVYSALLYSLLAYSYFHVFNMSETARRIRMLIELREHGEMTLGELNSIYNSKVMLDKRLERLVSLGQARIEGETIFLSSRKLFFAASLMSLWGRALGLPSIKGFYSEKR